MTKPAVCAGVSVLSAISAFAAPAADIEHAPVACVAAEKFPRLEARVSPTETVAAVRLVFQGQTADWYSVAMKPEGAVFVGVLPKPKKELKSFRYYIEVTDKAMGTNRTAEYTAAVVDSTSACKGKVMAGALGSASVILQGPAGVAALPAGFASSGVVAGSAAGTTAGAGSAATSAGGAAAGGGLGATALVVGGLAAGGAVAVGVAAAGGGDAGGDTSSSGSNRSVAISISFLPLPGIDISACGPGLSTFSSQGVSFTEPAGSFDTTWSPATPNVMRATGTASATSLQANISCTNGARAGTITATGSNYTMSGTFEFGSSRGQVSVVRQN